MSLGPLGIGPFARPDRRQGMEHVQVQPALRRVMAFCRCSIDDVVSDPCARNLVYGYWKLYKQVERTCEVRDLERQWNALG